MLITHTNTHPHKIMHSKTEHHAFDLQQWETCFISRGFLHGLVYTTYSWTHGIVTLNSINTWALTLISLCWGKHHCEKSNQMRNYIPCCCYRPSTKNGTCDVCTVHSSLKQRPLLSAHLSEDLSAASLTAPHYNCGIAVLFNLASLVYTGHEMKRSVRPSIQTEDSYETII